MTFINKYSILYSTTKGDAVRIRLDELEEYAEEEEEDSLEWKEEKKKKEMVTRKKIFKQGNNASQRY